MLNINLLRNVVSGKKVVYNEDDFFDFFDVIFTKDFSLEEMTTSAVRGFAADRACEGFSGFTEEQSKVLFNTFEILCHRVTTQINSNLIQGKDAKIVPQKAINFPLIPFYFKKRHGISYNSWKERSLFGKGLNDLWEVFHEVSKQKGYKDFYKEARKLCVKTFRAQPNYDVWAWRNPAHRPVRHALAKLAKEQAKDNKKDVNPVMALLAKLSVSGYLYHAMCSTYVFSPAHAAEGAVLDLRDLDMSKDVLQKLLGDTADQPDQPLPTVDFSCFDESPPAVDFSCFDDDDDCPF